MISLGLNLHLNSQLPNAWSSSCRAAGIGVCLVIGLMGLAADAQAMQVAPGQAPAVADAPRANTKPAATASPAPGSEVPTLDLIPGTVTSVEVGRASLVLAGQTVRWHPSQLKVVHAASGTLGQVTQLRPGMRIRFALEPGTAPDRRIVLIYVDTQP